MGQELSRNEQKVRDKKGKKDADYGWEELAKVRGLEL